MRLILTLLTIGLFHPSFAQNIYQCHNQHSFDASAFKTLVGPTDLDEPKSLDTKYIRTVVHLIYNNQQSDVPDFMLIKLIQDLNLLLRAEDIDESLIHPVHQDKIAPARIQFCLASIDEFGNSTRGVTHKETDTYFPADFLLDSDYTSPEIHKSNESGGTTPWDVDKYFNIWIVPMEDANYTISYGIPYPSFYPLGPLLETFDSNRIPGVVIDLDNISVSDSDEYADLISLFAHECGHVLGLLHTFGVPDADSTVLNFCEADDLIDDTPNCQIDFTDCSINVANSCDDGVDDLPDMHSNFMSYSPCRTIFSPMQIELISQNLSKRPELYVNSSCDLTSNENVIPASLADVFITPNPSKGSFKIVSSQANNSKLEVEIFDLAGNRIMKKSNLSIEKEIRLYQIETGVYFVKILSKEEVKLERIVIEN